MAHVETAAAQVKGSCVNRAVDGLADGQLLLLACAVMLLSSTGRAEVDTDALKERHAAVSAARCEQSPTDAEQASMIGRLCMARLLVPAAIPGSLRLTVQENDVKHAVRNRPAFAPLFPVHKIK